VLHLQLTSPLYDRLHRPSPPPCPFVRFVLPLLLLLLLLFRCPAGRVSDGPSGRWTEDERLRLIFVRSGIQAAMRPSHSRAAVLSQRAAPFWAPHALRHSSTGRPTPPLALPHQRRWSSKWSALRTNEATHSGLHMTWRRTEKATCLCAQPTRPCRAQEPLAPAGSAEMTMATVAEPATRSQWHWCRDTELISGLAFFVPYSFFLCPLSLSH
jgi:hypothetical protein